TSTPSITASERGAAQKGHSRRRGEPVSPEYRVILKTPRSCDHSPSPCSLETLSVFQGSTHSVTRRTDILFEVSSVSMDAINEAARIPRVSCWRGDMAARHACRLSAATQDGDYRRSGARCSGLATVLAIFPRSPARARLHRQEKRSIRISIGRRTHGSP